MNLFAVELRFEHPVSHERMTFKIYPPEDESLWNLFNVDQFLRVTKTEN